MYVYGKIPNFEFYFELEVKFLIYIKEIKKTSEKHIFNITYFY